MRPSRLRAPLALTFVLVASCGDSESDRFPLRDVVDERLRQLQTTPAAKPPDSVDESIAQDAASLVRLFAGGSESAQLLADTKALGNRAAPTFLATLTNPLAAAEQRSAAAALLGALDTERSASLLLDQLERAPESQIRSDVAFSLAACKTQDWITPRLLLRLAREHDASTRIGIASALGWQSNYAGLDTLYDLERNAAEGRVRDDARHVLELLAQRANFSDPDELWRAWTFGDPDERLPQIDPSEAHRRELWLLVADLADESKRDAARQALANGAAWTAVLLAEALHDDDPRIAPEAARALEAMGRRAIRANGELIAALTAPHVAVQAARALARCGTPSAGPALVLATSEERALELRCAAALALGSLRLDEARSTLEPLLEPSIPHRLRQSAASGLVELDADESAARVLREYLIGPNGDPESAEASLERWLAARRDAGAERASTALRAWSSHAGPPGIRLDASELAARQRARAEVLDEFWAP